jgi:hypothetical protein
MLGVAGIARQKGPAVIDPEALILFTGALGALDPRLREEAIDWCVSYGADVVSTSRMKNLMWAPADPQTGRFLASVNERGKARWPAPKGAKAWPGTLSGKSQLRRPYKEPALARVQLRALFGVSAKSEVILAMLVDRNHLNRFVSASELQSTGYSKRNVALVLDDLERASLLQRREKGNQVLYRLTNGPHLQKLAPCTSGALLVRWDLLFPALLAGMDFLARDSAAAVRSVEAMKLLDALRPSLETMQLDIPSPVRGEEERFGETVEQWLCTSLVKAAWR